MVQAEVLRLGPSKKKIFLNGCMVQAEVPSEESIQKEDFPVRMYGAGRSAEKGSIQKEDFPVWMYGPGRSAEKGSIQKEIFSVRM